MMLSDVDYYKRRAREHRLLAERTQNLQQRAMHGRLAASYLQIARNARRKQKIIVCPALHTEAVLPAAE